MPKHDVAREAQYIEMQMQFGDLSAVELELQELLKDRTAYNAVMAKVQADLKASIMPGHVEIAEDGTIVLDFGPRQAHDAQNAQAIMGEKVLRADDQMIVVSPDGTITDTRQAGIPPAEERYALSTVTIFDTDRPAEFVDNEEAPDAKDLELTESQRRQIATRNEDPRERLYAQWYQANQTGSYDRARELADQFNKDFPNGKHSQYMNKVAADYAGDPAGAMLQSYHQALNSGNFYMALSLGSRFVREHDDRPEAVKMRNWLAGVDGASRVTLDLSQYVKSGKVPTEYEIQQMVAEKLDYNSADVEVLGAHSNNDNPLSMFFKASDADGCQRLFELASANPNGLVNIGDLQPGAINQLKAFRDKLHPQTAFEPLPLVEATTGEKLALDAYNTAAQFANGATGTTADMIDGVGVAAGFGALGAVGGDQFLHDTARSLRSFGESLPMMGAYTNEDLNSAERCLLLFGAQTMGTALPYMAGTLVKGVGLAARGTQAARVLALGSEAEGALDVVAGAGELVGGTSRAGRALNMAGVAAEAGLTPRGAVIVNEMMGSLGNAGAMYHTTRDTLVKQWAEQHGVALNDVENRIDAKTKSDIELKARVTGVAGAIVGLLNPANVPALAGLEEVALKATQKLMVEKLAGQFMTAGGMAVALETLNRTVLATATGDASRLKNLGNDMPAIIFGGMISAVPGMAAEAAVGRLQSRQGQDAASEISVAPSLRRQKVSGGEVLRDSSGRVYESVDPNGERYAYEYNGERISKVTEPDGTVVERIGERAWKATKDGREFVRLREDYSVDSDGTRVLIHDEGKEISRLDGTRESVDLRGRALNAPPLELPAQKAALLERVNHSVERCTSLSAAEISRYKRSIEELTQRIEDRQVRDPMSDAQIAEAYKQVSKLLEENPGAPVSLTDRVLLAEQVMHELAYPCTIDQGANNTCNVTTIENRMATRDPNEVAALVAEVATTGRYRTADGAVIDMRGQLAPDPVALSNFGHQLGSGVNAKGREYDRTYAGQIFQTTAVNVHWQTSRRAPDGSPCAPGDIAYRIINGRERLVNTRTGAEYRKSDGSPIDAPTLSLEDMKSLHNRIAGKDDYDFIVTADSKVQIGNDCVSLDTPEGLARYLEFQKVEGNLPVIVYLPGRGAPGSADHSAHVVTVRDYDSSTGTAEVINQWGMSHDRLLGNPMTVSELSSQMYDATRAGANGP